MTSVSERSDLMKYWDYDKNTLDPSSLSLRSNNQVHWKCKKCGFEWTTTVLGRSHTKDGKCPCHDINRYIKQGVNDALTVYPELANDFREDLNPDISIGLEGVASHKKIRWKCHTCSYEWDSPIYSRVFNCDENGGIRKCPNCVNNRHVTSYGVLYPRLEELYSPKNKIPLEKVTRSPQLKYLWVCEIHGEFESSMHSMIRSVKHDNIGCPFCHGNKVAKEKSFGYCHPDLVADWSQENKVSPYDVSSGSHLNVKWECKTCGNKWISSVYNRHRGNNACKVCYPFGEKKGKRFCDKFPDAVKYYSDKNNKPITDFSVTSAAQVLWKCEKGHDFYESFYNYYQRGHFKCNVCKPKRIVSGVNDLLTRYPHLESWYDNSKNKKPISEISAESTREDTWWICPAKKHNFQRSVAKMVKDETCPICTGWKIIPGINDLLTAYPQVKDIWDYSITPEGPESCFENTVMYLPFCCEKGHHYKATMKRMIKYNFQCLICNGKILDPNVNSIKAIDPELAEEWSPNNDESPDQVLYSLSKKRLWICPICNGEYSETPSKRHVGDDSCPYCNNRAVLPGFNDVASVYPGLLPEWSKNNQIDPSKAGEFQRMLRRWTCQKCGSDYLATIKEKIAGTKKCEFCRNRRTLSGHNDLASNAPEMLDEWSDRNKKSPQETNFYLRAPQMWKCRKCDKEYGMSIQEKRARGDEACPYCNGKRVLPGVNDLATTDPDLVEEWSPDNKLPITLVKRDYIARYQWRCKRCNQNYTATIQQKRSNEAKCPYCENILPLPGFNDVATVYPELVKDWSPRNEYTVDHVLATSVTLRLWMCNTCHKDHSATIADRLNGNDSCPYCTNRKILPGYNDLATKYPELVSKFSSKNEKSPDTCLASMVSDIWWTCPDCSGDYTATIDEQLHRKDVCPYCAHRKALSGFNDLATVYPELIGSWSQNNLQTPDNVLSTSPSSWLWTCPDCSGDYLATVDEQLHRKDVCPYCAGRKVLPGFNSLDITHPELMPEWVNVGNLLIGILPNQVCYKSSVKAWWKCPDCGYQYMQQINIKCEKYFRHMKSCPYCKGRRTQYPHFI